MMKTRTLCVSSYISTVLTIVFFGSAQRVLAAPVPTTTAVAITSGGNTVASGESIASGSVVTLTATVMAGGNSITTGRVNFCDPSATRCTDIHLLGTAQLTSAGTAVLKFIPGIGSHTYKAVFAGTPNGASQYASSTSSNVALNVTGLYPTTTTIAVSGNAGDYTLTATVTGFVNAPGSAAPTGTVSFWDSTNGNLSVGVAPLGSGTAALSFRNSSNPATGHNAEFVALGDFNADGIPDLVVANRDVDGTLTILLGNGDGTFTQTANSPVAAGPSSVAVGDFNADAKPDLAVTNSPDATVTILLGNGDGTFTQAANSPVAVGNPPGSIVVGDFNEDGISDLAVADQTDSAVTILLGNGDGSFKQDTSGHTAVGSVPHSVAIGDFNGDGHADLAVGNWRDDTVTILLGSGIGTFAQATNSPFPAGLGPESIAVGDFNKDGIPDLAIANSLVSTVTILLGSGNGTFTSATGSPVTVGSAPKSVRVGDFNGDGISDLATANGSDGNASILLGNGDGTFTRVANSPGVGGNTNCVAVGSFTGDGLSDLVGTRGDGYSAVSVFLSQLTETATASATGVSPLGTGTHQIEASYPGNTYYGPSKSKATPTVVVTPSSASITTAQSLTVNVAVSDGTGNPMPTGSVTLISGSFTSAAVTLSSSSATINIPAGSLAAGTDTLTVSYTPDTTSSSIYTSASGTASLTVSIPPPIFSPAAGTYATAQTVTISDGTPGVTIYYTTNGTTPTTSSTVYSSPIAVSSTETIEAIASASRYTQSAIATAGYTINIPTNPLPRLGTMSPAFTSVGGPAFTLTVVGSGFTSGSTIYWGTAALATQFGSGTQLTAQVPASDIAAAGITATTVQTPTPGGGTSNSLQFEVDSAASGSTTPPSFATPTATVNPGSTATYAVTLTSSATNVSATCLNLPSGSSCSYSATDRTVTITTSPTTPAGTYQVTVVFTESEPGAATAVVLLPILLLPVIFAKRRLASTRIWFNASMGLVLLAATAVMIACAGGGSTGSTSTPPSNSTHQVTSSAVISLTIQ